MGSLIPADFTRVGAELEGSWIKLKWKFLWIHTFIYVYIKSESIYGLETTLPAESRRVFRPLVFVRPSVLICFFSVKLFKIILYTLARLFLFFTPARLPSDVPVVTLFKNGTIGFERRRAEGRSHRRGTKGPTAASIGLFSVAHTTVGRAWRILHIVKMKWM